MSGKILTCQSSECRLWWKGVTSAHVFTSAAAAEWWLRMLAIGRAEITMDGRIRFSGVEVR